jgi:transcriptional regulator with XRE-family HTH domain
MTSDGLLASEIPDATVAVSFGARVRAARLRQGLTLDHLAAAAGTSRATLSNLERGEHSPSLTAATNVARALGLSLAELLGDEDRRPVVTIPQGERLVFRDPATGIERQLLSPAFAGRGIEFIRAVLPAGAATDDLRPYHPAIDKYLLVERGTLRVVIGAEAYLVREGDAFYFRADALHRFENAGSDACARLPASCAICRGNRTRRCRCSFSAAMCRIRRTSTRSMGLRGGSCSMRGRRWPACCACRSPRLDIWSMGAAARPAIS